LAIIKGFSILYPAAWLPFSLPSTNVNPDTANHGADTIARMQE